MDNFKKLNIEKNISEKQSENFDKISLKNLSFKHHNKSNLTLENINLDIKKKRFHWSYRKNWIRKNYFY